MSVPSSSAHWRDTPLIPETYDDTATLVMLARQARMQPVEFDWYFSEDELRRLRRVVYERGRAYTGRYRLFDARMLAAIRDALGEEDTILVLREPRQFHLMRWSVASALPTASEFMGTRRSFSSSATGIWR